MFARHIQLPLFDTVLFVPVQYIKKLRGVHTRKKRGVYTSLIFRFFKKKKIIIIRVDP